MEQGNPFFCKECGWQFPDELIEKLKKDIGPVYCEMCGIENTKSDFNFHQTFKKEHSQKAMNLWDVFKTAKSKSIKYKKKIKSKLKNLKETLQKE